MDRDIIKELTKWLEHYRAYVENHAGCDVFMPYDNTDNAAEELYTKYIKPYQNQKAIECLYDMYDYIIENGILKDIPNFYGYHILSEYMSKEIKELEGKNERN